MEYLTVQVFFHFMNMCTCAISSKAFGVQQPTEKYSISLNFSDNPGSRICI